MIIILVLILLVGIGIWKFYPLTSETKALKQPNLEFHELSDALKAKTQVEYHINWAKHSGDFFRADQLECELASLELKISELQFLTQKTSL